MTEEPLSGSRTVTRGAPRTLLAIFAHPDDEVFGCGGTLALEAERGTRVVLAVATGGEAGEVVNRELRGTVDLAQLPAIRQEELRCSVRTLGISELINLGYHDSGMAGTPENRHPDAFMNADDDALAGRLVELVRRFRAQLLLTFDTEGGYGHSDHIKANLATHLAFDRAGDPSWYPEAGDAWQPARLFYWVVAREQMIAIRDDLTRRNIPVESGIETVREENMARLGVSRAEVSTVVDISTSLPRKLAALRCYATQTPPNFFYLQAGPEIIGEEFFVLAAASDGAPPPAHGLFEGLNGGG